MYFKKSGKIKVELGIYKGKRRYDKRAALAEKDAKREINFATHIEPQLKAFKSIQRISNVLGTIYDIPTVLKSILQECVKTIGFDQAFLYLIDDNGKYLECWTSYGFSPKKDLFAGYPKYNIEKDNCIEIQVLKSGKLFHWTGQPFYGKTHEKHKNKEKIRQRNSFFYVPLIIKAVSYTHLTLPTN